MSIVSVHGPNTFGSRSVVDVGPVQAVVNPSNGLIWTFSFNEATTRVAADFDWTFTGGTPATGTDTKGPVTVTYATPGSKTARLTVSGAGTGINPNPAAGNYDIVVTAVTGVAPLMAGGEGEGEGEGEESFSRQAEPEGQGEVQVGYDPAAHTVTEVIGFVEDNPDQLEDILLAEEEGKNRTTLISHLESMRP
jgi:hypothetical protein